MKFGFYEVCEGCNLKVKPRWSTIALPNVWYVVHESDGVVGAWAEKEHAINYAKTQDKYDLKRVNEAMHNVLKGE